MVIGERLLHTESGRLDVNCYGQINAEAKGRMPSR